METMFSEKLCIGCGSCAAVCEARAHVMSDQGHERLRERCTGCGKCVSVCPSGACEAAQRMMTAEEIVREAAKDKAFYGKKGGLTLSGGEPMAHPEACVQILSMAKSAGIHTAMETSGFFEGRWLEKIVPVTDLFLWDFKDSDSERHRKYTGQGNEQILENLRQLDDMGAKIRLRCILVNGVNLDDKHLSSICEKYHQLKNCVGVDLLPYHAYGSSKAVQLGRKDNAHPEWTPTDEQMKWATEYLSERSVLTE